jgi:hypothetical protein
MVSVLALSGCAFTPDFDQIQVPLAPQGGSLDQQVSVALQTAQDQQGAYLELRNKLTGEQKVRDIAILLTTAGVGATSIFRGDANSLKFAGFLGGAATFYDKSVPLSARIAAAQSAVDNYNNLILVGDAALGDAGTPAVLDDDARKFRTSSTALLQILDEADQMIKDHKAYAASACGRKAASTCAKDEVTKANKDADDLATLKASVATGRTTLTRGNDALKALVGIPMAINAASVAIDKTAYSGVAFTVDPTAISGGLTAVKAPGTASPGGAKGGLELQQIQMQLLQVDACTSGKTLSCENQAVLAAIKEEQTILDRTDYPGLLALIKATAPAAQPAPAAKTGATGGGSTH